MELSEFVCETLKQLIDGVKGAQAHAKKVGGVVSPWNMFADRKNQVTAKGGRPVQQISFDVAVTKTSGKETSGGIGVLFASVGLAGKAKSESTSSLVNRISFSVPVIFPLQK